MPTFIENFHFLRPLFLFGLIPAVLLVATLGFLHSRNSSWYKAIDASLLPFLLEQNTRSRQYLPLYGLLSIWVLSIIALAGPVWQQIPSPVQEREDAMVIVQDLSLSMYATDLNPSRLVRAQRKLIDILNSRKTEGQTALVVYAGSAHTVTPLTDDIATISNMVSALDPNIMPLLGSKPEEGIRLAIELLDNAQLTEAKILLITDGINNADIDAISDQLNNTLHSLSILGVGTDEGAPIPTNDGFLRDQNNAIVIPTLNSSLLQELADSVNGRYANVVLSDNDIDFLLEQTLLDETRNLRDVEQEFDTWAEAGPWLLLLVLPLAAFAFRRGWLLSICLLFLINPQQQAQALSWQDLWANKNQQGSQAFTTEQFDSASELFEDGNWRAASYYRNGNYQAALNELNAQQGINAEYNKGNTLARLERYQEAIDAYDAVLAEQPDHADALFNKAIVQNLLEEQQNMQNEDEQEDDQSQEQEQSESEQSQSEQQQNQEQAQQSEQDQENSEQSSEEQQESEVTDSDAGQEEQNEEEEQSPDPETAQTQESAEEEQAMQQWLGRIEDDPGELLRNKFRYQTQQLLYEQLQNSGIPATEAPSQIW
ncbi:MAG: VWA domain-containing protein [Pseudohongiellaceae bacterium]